jgi:hypothetical protein
VRQQGSHNGTAQHQNSHIPGGGDFLPKFLPKRGNAAKPRCYICWLEPQTGVAFKSVSPAFQAGHAGSIPVARSRLVSLANA